MKKLLIFTLVCLLSSIHAFAAMVPLYPQARVTEMPLVSLPETDLALRDGMKLAADAAGWYSIVYSGSWTGFVRGDAIMAPNRVQVGTSVYLLPSEKSPELTQIQIGDAVQVQPDSGWVAVTMQKKIRLFFKPTPEMLEALNPKPVEAPAPQEIGHSNTFEGVLQYGAFSFGGQNYSYKLVDASGTVIAWLDLSTCPIQGGILGYIGTRVTVTGLVRPVGRNRLIQVNSLRTSGV